jgi:hypothetical protein
MLNESQSRRVHSKGVVLRRSRIKSSFFSDFFFILLYIFNFCVIIVLSIIYFRRLFLKRGIFLGIAALPVFLLLATCYHDVALDPEAPGQLLPVAGVYNARDLGGYEKPYDLTLAGVIQDPRFADLAPRAAPNIPAKHVKYGVIFRTGDLNRLNENDVKYLQNLGIKAVIDFRGAVKGRGVERADSPDVKIPGALMGNDADPNPAYLSTIGFLPNSTFSPSEPNLSGQFGNRFAIEETVACGTVSQYIAGFYGQAETTQAMIDGYKRAIGNSPYGKADSQTGLKTERAGVRQFRNFFYYLIYVDGIPSNAMRTTPVPVIFHCSAGKDRTGMAAALFYSALGIPRETIINDYLLSAEYVQEKYYPVVANIGEQLYPLVTVKREYIEAFFKFIDDNYKGKSPMAKANQTPDPNLRSLAIAGAYLTYGGDANSPVIGYLTASLNTQTEEINFVTLENPLNPEAYATEIGKLGGLGLTDAEIGQLRTLYLE